ncbi:hypothetical protein K7I13_03435 [Brucepastera parasyntrophica]|uniref:hypothetical protein n=1 Tax=Brucepastera parasyntrophica TaxID=2880008 RepID=UPI002108ED3F|nr:hypothetical protein [Brucepastera parasyntrophica]ULQ60373.1 hypothetical protein K7I13_03435 [Brucepastera parasyntrophica]
MKIKPRMTKFILRSSAILLPFSMTFIVVLITLYMLMDTNLPRFVLPTITLVLGLLLWATGIILRTRSRFFFAASFHILTAYLLFLDDLGIFGMHSSLLWPFLVIFTGLSFFVAGNMHYGKPHPMYITISVAFFVLGLVFLIFASDIMNVSLISFFAGSFSVVIALLILLLSRLIINKTCISLETVNE